MTKEVKIRVNTKLLNLGTGVNPAPVYASSQASGMDLFSAISLRVAPGECITISTGVKVEIPDGFEGQIRPRSSLSMRGLLIYLGTVDSDYRGIVSVCLHNLSKAPYQVTAGDRIAQLVISKVYRAEIDVTDDMLSSTARGENGFGLTGNDEIILPDMELLRKFAEGIGGRRTGDLIRRGWIKVEVTEAGKAALVNSTE